MFYKEIICLANSYKLQHRCVAGKGIKDHKWIRPVSTIGTGELTIPQISFSDGKMPQLLDIIKVPFDVLKPLSCQPENILISNEKWEKTGEFQKDKLPELCDNPESIWFNEKYYNDKIKVEYFEKVKIESSLFLIKPDSLKILQDKKSRAIFEYNTVKYNLAITDPITKDEFNKKDKGEYTINTRDVYLCISLGEPFQGFCYKLVAGIIR
ncbi:MAG: hypothetical protein KJ706_00815 [Candidatus Omnitrophica bacterium]|nr:hypothetical protein [Candidatus Omnitrophota bacterium]